MNLYQCHARYSSATNPLFPLLFSRFYLRERQSDVPWLDNYGLDPQILRDFIPFLLQKENREYPDLCQLPGKIATPESLQLRYT